MPNPFAFADERSPSPEAAHVHARSGPPYQGLTGVNEQLQAHAAASNVPDHRFDDPPPPYRSRSPTPAVTAPGPVQSANGEAERIRELEEAAEAWPRLYHENRFNGWTTEQIQRHIDHEKQLTIEYDRREAEKQAAFKKWVAGFADSDDGDTDSDHPNPFRCVRRPPVSRKRRRTEVELLCEGARGMVESDAKTPKRVRRQRSTRDPRRISDDASEKTRAEDAPVGQRRSKRIAAMTKPAQIESEPVRSVKKAKSTASRRTKHKGVPASRKSPRKA